jgi:hypothetical protein
MSSHRSVLKCQLRAALSLEIIYKHHQTDIKTLRKLFNDFAIPLSSARSFPPPPTVKSGGKNQIHLILEAGHGSIVEDDLVVQPNVHFRGEHGVPIGVGVLVKPDLIISGIKMDFLNFD